MRTRSFCLLLLFFALSFCAKGEFLWYTNLDKQKILLVAEKIEDEILAIKPPIIPGLWEQLDADDKKVLGLEATRPEAILGERLEDATKYYSPRILFAHGEEKIILRRQKLIDEYIAKHYTVYVVPDPFDTPSYPLPKGKYPYLQPGVLSGKIKPGSHTSTARKTAATAKFEGIIKELAALFKKAEGFSYYDSKDKEDVTYQEQTFTKDQVVQKIRYKSAKKDFVVTRKLEGMPWQFVNGVLVEKSSTINT